MKRFAVVAVLASLIGACSEGGQGPGNPGGAAGSGDSDGGTGAPDAGTPMLSRVTVMSDEPALIAFRDEASPAWKTPLSPGGGKFELDVAGPYRVVVVCTDAAGDVFAVQFAQTLDDDRTIEQPCAVPPRGPFHVSGQMQQPGEVFLGGDGRGTSTAPWSFDMPAAPGTFDFLAFSGDFATGFDHVAIRRDLAIADHINLGMLDAAQDQAQALVPTQFTASNPVPGESLTSFLFVQSGNTRAIIDASSHPEPAWQINLVAADALRDTDTQSVQLSASAPTGRPMQLGRRSITRRILAGGSTSITLPEPLGPTSFSATADQLVATWASLPESDAVDLSRTCFADDFSRFVEHDLVLSRAFLTATGASAATLDFTDVPGFQPTWGLDPTFTQGFELQASRGSSPDDFIFSDVSETHDAPTPPGSDAPRADPRHATTRINAQRTWLLRGAMAARAGAPRGAVTSREASAATCPTPPRR